MYTLTNYVRVYFWTLSALPFEKFECSNESLETFEYVQPRKNKDMADLCPLKFSAKRLCYNSPA